jgi:hypothetical protein
VRRTAEAAELIETFGESSKNLLIVARALAAKRLGGVQETRGRSVSRHLADRATFAA